VASPLLLNFQRLKGDEPFPLLPLEEEGRVNDMPLRENFVEGSL
jgi:hypothetical protein